MTAASCFEIVCWTRYEASVLKKTCKAVIRGIRVDAILGYGSALCCQSSLHGSQLQTCFLLYSCGS